MRRRSETIEFTKEWLILCEGSGDKAFFKELIRKRQLPDFQVQFPLREEDGTGGWTKYGRFLRDQKVNEGFRQNVKAIIITADNDDDPPGRFQEISRQIRQAGYNAPNQPLELSRAQGQPDLVVMMLPTDGASGCLEHSLLRAAYSKWNIENAIDNYIGQTPANRWLPNKQAKARMQCLIATTCMQNPNTPLSFLWDRAEDYHIPVDHGSFNDLANFLNGFGAFLA